MMWSMVTEVHTLLDLYIMYFYYINPFRRKLLIQVEHVTLCRKCWDGCTVYSLKAKTVLMFVFSM